MLKGISKGGQHLPAMGFDPGVAHDSRVSRQGAKIVKEPLGPWWTPRSLWGDHNHRAGGKSEFIRNLTSPSFWNTFCPLPCPPVPPFPDSCLWPPLHSPYSADNNILLLRGKRAMVSGSCMVITEPSLWPLLCVVFYSSFLVPKPLLSLIK